MKSVVVTLISLHNRHPELCLNIERVLHAAAYFVYDKIYQQKVYIEFVYGKVFAIYFKTMIKQRDFAQKLLDFIKRATLRYPSLYWPTEETVEKTYYKRMVSFYTSLL